MNSNNRAAARTSLAGTATARTVRYSYRNLRLRARGYFGHAGVRADRDLARTISDLGALRDTDY